MADALKKKFYVSVKGAFVKNGRVLFLRNIRGQWQSKMYWDMPGGRIHEGETIEEALRRQVREETGMREFSIGKIIATYLFKTNVEYHTGLFIVIYKCQTEEEKITLSDEHDTYGWFTKEEIKNFDPGDGYYTETALSVLRERI